MAIFENSGTLKYKDKAGNLHIMKPRTISDNVEGLAQLLAEKENSGAAATALENAKAYTDQKIEGIPTPDVSAQIKAHNESQAAHPYIRGLIPTKTSQLDNDSGYLKKHQDISGKLDKPANSTTATAGQVLTKTADGQEWQDREKDIFWATYEKTSAAEMTAAFLSGKMVVANKTNGFAYVYHAVVSSNTAKCFIIDLTFDSDNQLLAANQRHVTSSGWWSPTSMYFTPDIHASDHATGGSDPITPASIGAATMTEVNSAIQSAIQNTWEASY